MTTVPRTALQLRWPDMTYNLCKQTLYRKTRQRTELFLVFLLLHAVCQCYALDERYEFHVDEEVAAGTSVGNVTLKTELKYKFVVGSGPSTDEVTGGGELFTLNQATGEITVRNRLDRETLGDKVEFVLTSYPSSRHVVEVLVHILDINDNPPVFPVSRVDLI